MASSIKDGNLTSVDIAFYKFANKCYSDKLDVVFKGGCVLRHIFRSINKPRIRVTKDIDFDVSEDAYLEMLDSYQEELRFGKLRDTLKVNVILLKSSIDCDVQILEQINPNICKVYSSPQGDFKGVVIEDMLADKIQSLSGDRIFGRAKDIADIFNIAIENKLDKDIKLLNEFLAKRTLGDFSSYRTMNANMVNEVMEIVDNSNSVFSTVDAFVDGVLNYSVSKRWNGRIWISSNA
jgi:predicted nucleotidyltransferase component of viral defense system